jgi:hypothetical protein
MRYIILSALSFCSLFAISQDTTVVDISAELGKLSSSQKEAEPALKVFYSQKLINANTVEVLKKGVLDFKVTHNFGDLAGSNGGASRFFGIDNAADIRIGFQVGLTDKLNAVIARAKGAGALQQLYELGLKYQILNQVKDDASHPVSLTVFANNVISAMKADPTNGQENSFSDFSDRNSQVVQLMLAKRFGNASFQLSPTYVHSNFVIPGDDNNIMALGAAARLPVSKKIVFIVDYFHSFRSESSENFLKTKGIDLYNPLGVGIEILTEGHVFHLNFTNATETLENRFLTRTTTTWNKGQYRWGFTITRNFILFKDKKKLNSW